MRHSSLTCIFVVSIFCLLQSCKNPSDPFDPQSGTFGNEQINTEAATLHAHGNLLLAGTIEGAFKKQLDGNATWNQTGLHIDSAQVIDFAVWNEQGMLAAVLYDSVRQHKPTLFKSDDTGNTWKPVDVNKPEGYDYFVVHFLEPLQPSNPKDIIAYAGRILKSVDQGQSWVIIYEEGSFSEFLTVSPYHPDQIWTGGWTSIFSPYLAKSTDGGQSWETVLKGINTRTLTHSTRNPEIVYASGRNANGSLFFVASSDFGESWEQIQWNNSPAGVQVNDMVSVMEGGREVLYFGTNKGVSKPL